MSKVDTLHYSIFHQMEGVKVFSQKDFGSALLDQNQQLLVVKEDLKCSLEGMAKALFGNVQMGWVDAYFPFTKPLFELEIYFGDKWLEVLGFGVIQQEIIANLGQGLPPGWASRGWPWSCLEFPTFNCFGPAISVFTGNLRVARLSHSLPTVSIHHATRIYPSGQAKNFIPTICKNW